MVVALRALKVKVKVTGQANAVGSTSMEGSFSSFQMFLVSTESVVDCCCTCGTLRDCETGVCCILELRSHDAAGCASSCFTCIAGCVV